MVAFIYIRVLISKSKYIHPQLKNLPLIREPHVNAKRRRNIPLLLSTRLEIIRIFLEKGKVIGVQFNQFPVCGDAVWVDRFCEDDGATRHCNYHQHQGPKKVS